MNKTIKRFRQKYDINENGCYIWQGATRGNYGLFRFNNKIESAHRVSYMLFCEEIIPSNMVIRHTCDNPLCVNPNHLTIGTNQDNYNDRNKRAQFNSKLTGEQVRYIFNSDISDKELSQKYNIGIDAIKRIKQGKAWREFLSS